MTLTSEVLNRYLPKWPQMIVVGQPVTPEQALEVIRRTDTFFTHGYGGNDHRFDNMAKEIVGMPNTDLWREPAYKEMSQETQNRIWRERWDSLEAWRAKWGIIETEYVHNSWISCAYVGGPHGWCHPDGKIYYTDNVGKWPSVEAIRNDWKKIAQAFPFLDLRVALMNGESCELGTCAVAGFRVKSGRVRVLPGESPQYRDLHTMVGSRDLTADLIAITMLSPAQREHRLGLDQLEAWQAQVFPAA
jgi:hypothetical protein